jgi:hypothetical protein
MWVAVDDLNKQNFPFYKLKKPFIKLIYLHNVWKNGQDMCVMIKNEFIDLGFEIWMRLLQNAEKSYGPHSEDIAMQHPSEPCIFPKH